LNKSESIAKIASAFVKAQSEMGNAVKDSKNPFFKSSYADLNSVREACLPALNKHGISVLQPTSVIEGKLYVETLLLHESGEYLSGMYEVVVGKQNDPQALGAAISYSRRYGLQSMVNIGAADDDGESAVNRSFNSKPVIQTPLQTTGVSQMVNVATSITKEAPPAASTANRGSFRKNPAQSTSVPSGDL
jgi:hypothetical protein